MTYYNRQRPHQSLGGQTAEEYCYLQVTESINGTDSIIMRNAWYIEQEGLSVPADRENIVALQQQGPLSLHYAITPIP